jgi:hypothetical protein
VLSRAQATTVLTKRGISGSRGASLGALQLATAFPRHMWLDHLLPLLTLGEAVTLRATCKAMPAIVADIRADLGRRPVKHLKAMLTCFPKAESVDLHEGYSMTPAEQDGLIAWLKERGNSLQSVHTDPPPDDDDDGDVDPLVIQALRAGAFKTVKSLSLCLYNKEERDLIINGVVTGLESITVALSWWEFNEPDIGRSE